MKLTTLAMSASAALLTGLATMSALLITGDDEVDALDHEAAVEEHELGCMLELSVRTSELVDEALIVIIYGHSSEAFETVLLRAQDAAVDAVATLADCSRDIRRDGRATTPRTPFAELARAARELRDDAAALVLNLPPELAQRLVLARLLEQQFKQTVLAPLEERLAFERADTARTQAAQSDALASLRLVSIVAPLVLFCLLALGLGLWLPRFVRRLRRLEQAARSIGAGATDVHLDLGGHDELTDAADAFNAMSRDLRRASQFLRDVYKTMPGGLIIFDADGRIEAVNDATLSLLQYREDELVGQPMSVLFPPGEVPDVSMRRLGGQSDVLRSEHVCRTKADAFVPVLFSASMMPPDVMESGPRGVVCIALDIRDRKKLELELRQAQKLESVGRLAAGIAHEINTPVQYVSDSVSFVEGATNDFCKVIAAYRALTVDAAVPSLERLEDARRLADELDVDYLLDNVPGALERARDGLSRVASIVRSMTEFAHPGTLATTAIDLNHAIANTLNIASNEYRYVADVATELGDIPCVEGHAGELNQVVLNLIVNAAHAIADVVGDSGARGRIDIKTWVEGGDVVVSVGDTGGGIPVAIRERIFDPFFTTKDVGRGTGQGLAIARSVVHEKHRGKLSFESVVGQGTTFFIRLPAPETTRLAA